MPIYKKYELKNSNYLIDCIFEFLIISVINLISQKI